MQERFRARAVLCALALLLSCNATLSGQGQQAPITLSVDAREAPRGILHAQLIIPVESGPLTLLYPKWIPGEHGPTGPISDLVGLKIRSNGQDISWRRDAMEMYAFHCEVPAGVQSLEVSLDFLTPIESSGFTSGASTTPFLAVINWNQLLLYPQGGSASSWTYSVRLVLPEGWKFGTALPVKLEEDTGVEFRPVSLETLVDSPVIAGRYLRHIPLGEADGRPHAIDMVADDESWLEMKPGVEAGLRGLVTESGELFGARHYNQYRFLLTLSDQVAHFGLEHHESSDNRLAGNALSDNRAGPSLGSLLPHEFVHSWNGKYRRPAGLATANYDQPMDTRLLWVYEGLTTYLGYVLAGRSGLWSPADFRARLAQSAAALEHRVGRTWRPLEDTAVSAQVLYFSRSAWSDWRRGTDFYDEAAFIWLEVDVMLRQKSQGRSSLDDFCRRFYGGSSGVPAVVPFTFQDIIVTLTELVPHDWNGFFEERLNSTAPHAPLGGMEQGGWRLDYSDTAPGENPDSEESQRADLRYSLGMSVGREGEIRDVTPNGPAYQAGLAPDMRIVAVNGRKYSTTGIRQAIRNAKDSSDGIELLAVDREFYRTYRVDYRGGERYPYLERDPSRPDLLHEIIQPLAK
ncbi:MAG: M61 family metallopeptidase [Acidobacteria bacterium]|nr:M61 family metallopeptidase [Acidobacteriota bacterium]